MIITLQAFVMTFGAAVASAGLVLLFLRKEQGENKVKLFGQEFQLSTPALVVFLAGCTIFILPLVLHIDNLDKALISVGQPKSNLAGSIRGTPPSHPASPIRAEKEPNDHVMEANLIQLGTVVRGSIATAEDRDFFKFGTPGGVPTPGEVQGKIRVILRKLSNAGFYGHVAVYDRDDRVVHEDYDSGDRPVSLLFESDPSSYYSVRVKGGKGPYELEVREQK